MVIFEPHLSNASYLFVFNHKRVQGDLQLRKLLIHKQMVLV